MAKTLVIVLGPTGIGKTDLSIEIAQFLNTEIISCDSRQFYKELSIGTAVPSAEQLSKIKHHLIHSISIKDYYNAYLFEQDALKILNQIFTNHDFAVMVGGSGMYIDALCNGIDLIPDIDPKLRDSINNKYETEGLASIQKQLLELDPEYYQQVDLQNPARIIRAIEVCIQTGKPYSNIRSNTQKERDFNIIKIGLKMGRSKLYERINDRVDQMIEQGLQEEVKSNFEQRHLNALNTVGYKEVFQHLEGNYSLERAIELIKRNTRHYAKKQISWFNRDETTHWFHPNEKQSIFDFIKSI